MLAIEALETTAGTFRLRGINLTIPRSSYAVLLGPPGSGKSVFIETICGLRRPTAGRILLDGRDITHLEPRHRRIGYVPQDYALFPTKRVLANITFGLRARGVARAEATRRVQPLIELLNLEKLLDRYPPTLSGGEQQRVALARALATDPRLLLLDEPVSALDEVSRDRLCRELRRIQRELTITTLHISHNLEEAFSVADLAAVMQNGRLVQVGPLEELVRRPRTVFVARFLRAENVFAGWAEGKRVRVKGPRAEVVSLPLNQPSAGRVSVMVRPENIELSTDGQPAESGAVVIPARVERRVDRGAYVRVDLDGPLPLVVHASHQALAHLPPQPTRVYATIRPQDVHLLEEDDE